MEDSNVTENSFQAEESTWDDPGVVHFEFIPTGRSRGDGVLSTHDNNFKVNDE